jgi:serine/threonine protein kinase
MAEGYGKAVDWWSFACVVFEMLVGIPPFYSKNMQEMYTKITTCDLKFPDFLSQQSK